MIEVTVGQGRGTNLTATNGTTINTTNTLPLEEGDTVVGIVTTGVVGSGHSHPTVTVSTASNPASRWRQIYQVSNPLHTVWVLEAANAQNDVITVARSTSGWIQSVFQAYSNVARVVSFSPNEESVQYVIPSPSPPIPVTVPGSMRIASFVLNRGGTGTNAAQVLAPLPRIYNIGTGTANITTALADQLANIVGTESLTLNWSANNPNGTCLSNILVLQPKRDSSENGEDVFGMSRYAQLVPGVTP